MSRGPYAYNLLMTICIVVTKSIMHVTGRPIQHLTITMKIL